MLGIPPVSNHIVIIAPHTTFMACIWIQRGINALFSVAAYKQYTCTNFQIGRGVIFNPTWVTECITDFLHHYSLHNAYIAFVPDYTSITHGFVATDTISPEKSFFEHYNTRHVSADLDYLYTDESYKYVHYWCQIPRSLVLQYQCIAVLAYINCIRVTPRFCALLHAYRAVQGPAFRRTQLGIDLIKHNHRLSHYFQDDIVRRLVSIRDHILYTELKTRIDIIAASGIAYLHWENI